MSDYANQTVSVTLSASRLTECVQINLVDDADLDPDEEFTLVLSTTTGATVNNNFRSALVTITDNEQGKLMNTSSVNLVHRLDDMCTLLPLVTHNMYMYM